MTLGNICKNPSMAMYLVRRNAPLQGFGVKLNAENDSVKALSGSLRGASGRLISSARSMYTVTICLFVTWSGVTATKLSRVSRY